ncbi:hypothetical protein I4U23_024868 [Adineta vaga]|nr:hypothetical protein I4U23_024868 [Adineta vaga]
MSYLCKWNKKSRFKPSSTCINCSSNSFCPLGAAYELNSSSLISVSQAYAYPRSPDMTSFEDILLQNMFTLGTTTSCLLISPIFWTLILCFLFLTLLFVMASFSWCMQPHKRERYRTTIKSIFQRTDLVGEGEMWLGGLASIAVILMSIMAYTFAISYMYQYPIETTQGSKFACDSSLRNAQFQSNLQALAVPVSTEEKPIFDLLDAQNFTLQIDLLNTVTSCIKIALYEVTDSSTTSVALLSCSNLNGTVSTTIRLSEHALTIKAVVSDIQLIGGLRVGISGAGQERDSYTLKELNFLQTFYSQSLETLSQSPIIKMALTKVINQTESLFNDDDEKFGGIWYPTFTYSSSEMFLTAEEYRISANLTSTSITIDISETSYYIKNTQSPIAKQPEVIFRTLLFAFLCLELCAMIFLICKLLVVPLINKISTRFFGRPLKNIVEPLHDIRLHHH